MSSQQKISVRNPRTGEHDYSFSATSPEDVAISAAKLREHQTAWLALGLNKRIEALRAFADALANNQHGILEALTDDTGRRMISKVEVDSVANAVERWARIASQGERVSGVSSAMPHIRYHVDMRPFALVGIISPWNFPLTLSLIDALPALTAGAAVILKPSEVTPRFAEPLRKIIAGIENLSDVFSIVDGDGATGAAVVDHVDAICFTGSVATGRKVGEQAARNFIPSFLELGGKDPAIVLESADIDRATTALLRGSILNAGQACQSIERIYVARPIFDTFRDMLVEKAKAVTINADDIHAGHLGPIIFHKQANILAGQINNARDKGATVHTGGEIVEHGGLWCYPTVITGLTTDMKIMNEETFGPLLPLIPFDSTVEAITMANASEYGLSAAVFAGTVDEAIAVGEQIEAGGISINDAALTALMNEAEKDSFKLSGLGAPRMGTSGYTRFFRKQSFMINEAGVFGIGAFNESNLKN